MTQAVELRGITHDYGETAALAPTELSLDEGEFVSIIGPSGCGKSTLIRIVAGLLRPSTGSVKVDGQDTTGNPGRVAYLPQGDLLLPWKRAFDNAIVGLKATGNSSASELEVARLLFSRFGLVGFERAWPHELSGGMRQRLSLLRTFLVNHPVLALDEPFGALDALTRSTMQAWLRGVWLEDRRTTLLITHDIDEAILLSDRLLVMSPRPGSIIDTFEIDLPLKRDADIVVTPAFGRIKAAVMDSLRRSHQAH